MTRRRSSHSYLLRLPRGISITTSTFTTPLYPHGRVTNGHRPPRNATATGLRECVSMARTRRRLLAGERGGVGRCLTLASIVLCVPRRVGRLGKLKYP